jgi:oligoendopeptidase F
MEAVSRDEPNWDMTPYFPEVDGDVYREFRKQLAGEVAGLLREAQGLGAIAVDTLTSWASLLARLEDVSARSNHLAGYLGCLGAADSRDETVQRESASAAAARAELEKVFVTARAAIRGIDDDVLEALAAEQQLDGIAYFLERLRKSAEWSMAPELEELTSDLGVTGLSAWGRLYSQASGTLEFDLDVPGEPSRRLPVSVTRSLLEDPDPQVRKAALANSNAAWERIGDVTAACLNAIAGTRHTLYARRGIDHFLEPALFDAAVTRRTLDCLLEVVTARQELARRFLRRKARILGREKLGFQDLMAPLPLSGASISWEAGRDRVLDAFGRFYPALAEFAQMAFDQRWIDYETRLGKRPGGFCSSSSVIGQSRIFLTYNRTLGDVATLAHELGHAFHSWLMREMRPWSRRYPMTLAETASTFAEQLVIDAVLENPDASAEDRAVVLDSRMQDAATFLLNIPMRYLFEKAVYEERQDGELSIGRFKQLMLDAQRQSYGDCLADDELDPWFWASKLHFYITGVSFYNFPYTFGYLFSMGIFARAKREGPDFLPRYEELLRLAGSDTAEAVARRCLGVDLEKPDFWNASIDLIERDLASFESAADEVLPR